jgi:hypothetical protein
MLHGVVLNESEGKCNASPATAIRRQADQRRNDLLRVAEMGSGNGLVQSSRC